mgnify:CR=1 FL=1
MNYWRNTKYEYDASFGHLCGRNCFAGLAKGAEVETIGGLIAIVDEIDKENNRIVLDAEGVFLTFDLSRSIMKVITPAPTTETAETTEKTIIEEDSAIESADEN